VIESPSKTNRNTVVIDLRVTSKHALPPFVHCSNSHDRVCSCGIVICPKFSAQAPEAEAIESARGRRKKKIPHQHPEDLPVVDTKKAHFFFNNISSYSNSSRLFLLRITASIRRVVVHLLGARVVVVLV